MFGRYNRLLTHLACLCFTIDTTYGSTPANRRRRPSGSTPAHFFCLGSRAANVISKGSVSSWWFCRRQYPSLLIAGALWRLTLDSALCQQKTLAITTSTPAQEQTLRRSDTVQCIDRIFSRTSNIQQQEATHNAEIFVKAIHAGDLICACDCPIAVPDKRSSQRV